MKIGRLEIIVRWHNPRTKLKHEIREIYDKTQSMVSAIKRHRELTGSTFRGALDDVRTILGVNP